MLSLKTKIENALRSTKRHFTKLNQMGIFTVEDLLMYFPRTLENNATGSATSSILLDKKNTIRGKIFNITSKPTSRGTKIYKAKLILDDESEIEAIWFRAPYQLKNIKEGRELFLTGKIKRNYGVLQFQNPEIHLEQSIHVESIRTIYPESPPITSKWLREKIDPLLPLLKNLPNVIPNDIRDQEGLMPRAQAIQTMHRPSSFDAWNNARKSLGFEEIFEIQLRVMQAKHKRAEESENRYKINFDPEQIKKDLKELPFELTFAQKKVLFHVLEDMKKNRPAHRLVQGDVGSGKTIVALLAAKQVIRAGYQAAILAPTEILAAQHFKNALTFFGMETTCELLTGSVTAKNKTRIKTGLANGQIQLVVGTHAILTQDTEFKELAIAIIDEQHRFGVRQRAVLSDTGAHTIAMTATPIPRSLALTLYGDQDISVIDEMPAGRKPIVTRIISDTKTQTKCERFIDDQIEKGRQIFWVCPLVDESDKIEAKNVMTEFERIAQSIYPHRRVTFLHGKMKPKEKDAIMAAFRGHEFDILVSTSVIEVGVDIPKATVMVIENSERFGLSQLHQFRGRIGRNDLQSYCFLMVGSADDKNKARLRAMEKSNDGFYLSEVDLKLRGAGDIYGVRQSGLPDLKCADLSDTLLMEKARHHAETIISHDIDLKNYPVLQQRLQSREVFF